MEILFDARDGSNVFKNLRKYKRQQNIDTIRITRTAHFAGADHAICNAIGREIALDCRPDASTTFRVVSSANNDGEVTSTTALPTLAHSRNHGLDNDDRLLEMWKKSNQVKLHSKCHIFHRAPRHIARVHAENNHTLTKRPCKSMRREISFVALC